MAPARALSEPATEQLRRVEDRGRLRDLGAGADLGRRHGAERRNRRTPARGNARNFVAGPVRSARESARRRTSSGASGATGTGGREPHAAVGRGRRSGGRRAAERRRGRPGSAPASVACPTSQPWVVTSSAAVATRSGLARSSPPTSTSPGTGPAPRPEQGAGLLLDRRDPPLGGVREVHLDRGRRPPR